VVPLKGLGQKPYRIRKPPAPQRLEHRGLISIWKSVSAQPLYGLRTGDRAQSVEDYLGNLE
jgi:hypothetical protein